MWRSAALIITVALGFAGCAGNATPGDGCRSGEVEKDGRCVTLCNADTQCSGDTICVLGVCAVGIRPEVVAFSPTAGATDVPRTAVVALTFSVPMEPVATAAAFVLTGPQGAVAGAIEWNGTNLSLTFTPAAPLVPGGLYQAQVGQTALSAAGVPLADRFSLSFSVYLPPVIVVGMTPVPGAVDVGISPLIAVTFSVPMDPISVRAATSLLYQGSAPVAGNRDLSPDGTVLTFVPGATLVNGAHYTLQVDAGAAGVDGGTLAETFAGSFTVTSASDAIQPIVSVDPITVVVSGPDLDSFGSFAFTGSATDNETGIEQVYVQVVPAGQPLADAWSAASLEGSAWTYRWFPRLLTSLPNGSYTLYVRAVDKGANEASGSQIFAADLVPPPTPNFVGTPPTAWKFETLSLNVQGEVSSRVEVLLDATPVLGSPFNLDVTGLVTVQVPLMTLGAHALAFFGVDAEGNRNATPLLYSVNRTAYTCLTVANGFPAPGATLAVAVADDRQGNVTVTYALNEAVTQDTHLTENDSSANGSEDYLELDSDRQHVLIAFADSLLPPGCAVVAQARLVFSVQNFWNLAEPIALHPLTRAWSESAATWANAATSSPWGTPGAYPTDTGSMVASMTIDTELNPDVGWADIALQVQRWTSGTANHGLLLRAPSSNGQAQFYASSYWTEGYRPRLELSLREPD